MPFDTNYSVVVNIDPQFALKQILVLPVRNCLGYETTVRPDLLLAEQIQRIVFRRDGAIMMLLACCGFDLAGDKLIQRHSTNDSRSRFRCDDECFLVRCVELHPPDLLGVHLSF